MHKVLSINPHILTLNHHVSPAHAGPLTDTYSDIAKQTPHFAQHSLDPEWLKNSEVLCEVTFYTDFEQFPDRLSEGSQPTRSPYLFSPTLKAHLTQ